MDHPAIVKVFEAGSTPQGRPYFTMEYVAGQPITLYADRHNHDSTAPWGGTLRNSDTTLVSSRYI